jgi:hypothetical protein
MQETKNEEYPNKSPHGGKKIQLLALIMFGMADVRWPQPKICEHKPCRDYLTAEQ